MKKFLLSLFALILPLLNFAQEAKELGVDEKIDQAFGNATGWFVQAIFYQIPIGEVDDNVAIDLVDINNKLSVDDNGDKTYASEKGIRYLSKNDSLYISNISLTGDQVAEKIELISKDIPVSINGGSLSIANSDINNNSLFEIKVYAPFTKVFWVLFPLILGAIFFTFYFKFINFRGFLTSVNIVRGKYDEIDHHESLEGAGDSTPGGDAIETIAVEGHEGEVSHFQALTAALSATVGLGNIAGVAIAVSIGGAGATFWMIVAGFLGMASKFVECTLGVKYRDIAEDGTVYGGPMYYLTKGLKSKGYTGLGKVLAALFAVFVIGGSFGGGNMFQVNQAFQLVENITGGEKSFLHGYGWAFGLVMAILVGIVIIGGIKKIAKVTDKIVPFMVVIYVAASLFVIFANFNMIGDAFGQIFDGAFSPEGVAGGAIGVLVQGFRRAAFSNEAGVGSASIAHSAVKTKYAASEGMVALLEPFIDTVVVCTMTALVLIITGNVTAANAGLNDAQAILLTSGAFESAISWFPYVLTIAVVLFAFSTMISWSYYGFQGWAYLFGRTKKAEYTYKVIFCVFVIIGAAASLGSVIGFSDAMIFAMMVPNMIGLVLLAPKVKSELKRYMDAIKAKKA
ncbi:sodium:alanine symporter family protein [Winogradskyella sp.]|jgi:AGCS family alanine or glycine:cation symporter|uniref:alanine/glycine:cation symporter family protein n=1 Tax=Winogradskyella sp. TaxID=1883156 RepID=UPI0025EC43F0|nr:alanine/glycine:cation symporter family protein [Winogradskyella sp.]MCT4629254.1 alanine:cation symporter family protein [Winogradskyella sp.]